MLVSNIDWSDYVGRIAVGKILGGTANVGDTVFVVRHSDGKRVRAKITKVFEFTGLGTARSADGVAGNIVGISGFEDIDIGDTLTADENGHALPFTQIDPPTLEMQFCVNDGPLVGQEGKLVTSRQLRERLIRELKTNVSIYIEDTDKAGIFNVKARGAMQVAVLVETMRREGFELLVSRPTVIEKTVDGQRHEPYETVWIEVPDECVGAIMQNLANRKGLLTNMEKLPALHDDRGHHHHARPHRHGNRRRQRHQRPRRAQPSLQGIRPLRRARCSPASPARSSRPRPARPPPTPS